MANSCTVAKRNVTEAPEVGRNVLRFALLRLSKRGRLLLAPTYACLVRLAVKLKDQKALNAFLDPFVTHALVCQAKPQKIHYFTR